MLLQIFAILRSKFTRMGLDFDKIVLQLCRPTTKFGADVRRRRPRVCSPSVEHLGFSTLADIIHLNILRIVFEAAYNTGTLSLRDLTSCFSICYVSTSNFLLFR